MNCPVCQHQNISPLATFCPHCGSDLVQFSLLDNVEEEYIQVIKDKIALEGDLVEQEKRHENEIAATKKRFNHLIWLLFSLPFFMFLCGRKHVPTAAPVLQGVPVDTLHFYKKQLADYTEQLEKAKYADIDSIRYIIREGDRLGKLGEMFFWDYDTWRKIKEENNIEDEHKLLPGDTLILRLRLKR